MNNAFTLNKQFEIPLLPDSDECKGCRQTNLRVYDMITQYFTAYNRNSVLQLYAFIHKHTTAGMFHHSV